MEYHSPPSSSSSASSSPRLSALSTSTSTSLSSAFSGSDLSSLPSPSVSPAPRESLSDFINPGAKTHAFFASPFATRPPSPLQPSVNASTSTITPIVPLIVAPRTPDLKKRDFLWLDLNSRTVEDLSTTPTPISAEAPDEATPRLPSAAPPPVVHEELAVGSIIRARAPPRSRTVSTDNSGILSSASSSPLSQSPISQVAGLPAVGTPHSVSFPGLPPDSPDIGPTMLTAETPRSSGTTLRLTAPLGTGAFSSVWLAEDLSDDPLVLRSRRSLRNLRREGSLSRASSLRKVRVPGVRPLGAGKQLLAEHSRRGTSGITTSTSNSSSLQSSPSNSALNATRLVALKMTARSAFTQPCSGREEALQRDRTRVSFVREVEVLRHISHPNITTLLTHLTTPSYHVLVLPYLPGGDLLGLVNSDEAHNSLTEHLLRRMWCELCKAVGWMHGVGLVHRDVKLENILLTTPFPLTGTLPSGPLIKLTDFGLSRFIDTTAPLLSTRCGSEAYASPELVISGRRYDARETDAWACGVVLYALCARRLPFGEGAAGTGAGRIGREGGVREGAAARRHWLMCIARGEYEWPATGSSPSSMNGDDDRPGMKNWESGDSEKTVVDGYGHDMDGDKLERGVEELAGPRLVESEGARGIVARLLVRDPTRRAKISELWDEPWMGGSNSNNSSSSPGPASGSSRLISAEVETQSPGGAGSGSPGAEAGFAEAGFRQEYASLDVDAYGEVEGFEDEDLEGEEEDVDEDGVLLDQDGIDSIARQEVQ